MLGNDVVDLNWSPKNGTAYFKRLESYAFSAQEISLVSNFGSKIGCLLMWSLKEATYKSSVKMGNRDRFKPSEFNVLDIKLNSQRVESDITFKENWFKGRSTINNRTIHSLTIDIKESFEGLIYGLSEISSDKYSDQSISVRKLAVEHLNSSIEGNISFNKDEWGMPFVLVDEKRMDMDLTFSHHGKIIGYALRK